MLQHVLLCNINLEKVNNVVTYAATDVVTYVVQIISFSDKIWPDLAIFFDPWFKNLTHGFWSKATGYYFCPMGYIFAPWVIFLPHGF